MDHGPANFTVILSPFQGFTPAVVSGFPVIVSQQPTLSTGTTGTFHGSGEAGGIGSCDCCFWQFPINLLHETNSDATHKQVKLENLDVGRSMAHP